MTKATLKNMYQERVNEVWNNKWNDTTLEELKELNVKYGDGHKWCSWDMCLQEIIKGGNSTAIDRALQIYQKHIEIKTLSDEYTRIAKSTNNMKI